jgi:hypothetical protein
MEMRHNNADTLDGTEVPNLLKGLAKEVNIW